MSDFEKAKERISNCLVIQEEDKLINHLKTAFKVYNYQLHGNTTNSRIVVWKWNRLSGLFYPVITFEENLGNKIILKTKLNIVGRIFYYGFSLVLIAGITTTIINDNFGIYRDFSIRLLIGIFCIISWFILTYMAYKVTLQSEIEQISSIIRQESR
jgi:hypothetical protein